MTAKTSTQTPDLSIIIPAYQEAKIIQSTLKTLADWLKTHDYGKVEVIVSVAESPDGTLALAKKCANLFDDIRFLNVGARQGKGHNVRAGMLAATGKYRLFMDADLATPLKHLDDAQHAINQNHGVIIATRPLATIHKDWRRKFATQLGNIITRVILLPGINDSQCGFKIFRADVAEIIFNQLTVLGWGFDMEVLALARKLGHKIHTFPAPDWYDPKGSTHGLTGDSVLRVSFQVFKSLLGIRIKLIRNTYKI